MIVIRSGRHPYAIAILGSFAAASLAGLTTPTTVSGTTLLTLPLLWLYLFYAALLGGSVTSLIGAFTRGLVGPAIERVGMWVLGINLIGYGGAILGLLQWRGLFFGLLTIALGVASLYRGVQIGRELSAAKAGAAATGSTAQLGGRR